MPLLRSVVNNSGCFSRLLSVRSTIWSLLRSVVSLSPAAQLKTAPQQSLYIKELRPRPRTAQRTNQKERHAICAVSCLVTCQQRKKTNRRRRRRSWGGNEWQTLALWKCPGTCPDSEWSYYISSKSFMRTNKSFFLPPLYVAMRRFHSRKVQHLSVGCAAENMTSPVLFEHYISFFFILLQSCKHSQDTVYIWMCRDGYTQPSWWNLIPKSRRLSLQLQFREK